MNFIYAENHNIKYVSIPKNKSIEHKLRDSH